MYELILLAKEMFVSPKAWDLKGVLMTVGPSSFSVLYVSLSILSEAVLLSLSSFRASYGSALPWIKILGDKTIHRALVLVPSHRCDRLKHGCNLWMMFWSLVSGDHVTRVVGFSELGGMHDTADACPSSLASLLIIHRLFRLLSSPS